MSALFELFPLLRQRVPRVPLAELPTPVEAAPKVLAGAGRTGELWLKRDDLSSPIYGGNKVRLLEHVFAEALQRGAQRVYSTGAMGSSFALATALHAPRVGLSPFAIAFREASTEETERSHAALSVRAPVVSIAHWSLVPLAAERAKREAQRDQTRAEVLSQVSFSPTSLSGYVSAGLELALQVSSGACAKPSRIVLPIGSAATSAGILAGLSLARRLGIWRDAPSIEAVRIAAFPLSRRGRVLSLATRTLGVLAQLSGDSRLAFSRRELLPLTVIGDQLGDGYAAPTAAGRAARAVFAEAGYPILDDTYSAKAAAHALAHIHAATGPLLLWCTKSSAPLEPRGPTPSS